MALWKVGRGSMMFRLNEPKNKFAVYQRNDNAEHDRMLRFRVHSMMTGMVLFVAGFVVFILVCGALAAAIGLIAAGVQ